MTRLVLSLSVASAVLAVGLSAAFVQSRNFARAAELDRLQRESDWFLRRTSGLKARTQRMDFALRVQQNQDSEERAGIAMEGRD